MADEHIQTAKESKGFGNRLKKVFRFGSQSTPQSRSNSPQPFAAPPAVTAPSAVLLPPVMSGAPLVSSPPPVDAPAPVPPPPAITAPPVDPASPADLKSPNDPAPPIDPASTVAMTPEEAAKLRAKYTHFRILVIGRANAGKTTLLKRVCKTEEDPVYNSINPTDKRGIHNVRDEFTFKSNPGFIFHDSPGFEAGGEKELMDVMSFIEDKAKAREVGDQIHVIWFCFEPDVSRPLLELESKFFKEQRAGNVPVVAIFTKFDVVVTKVYDMDKDDEENWEIACVTLKEKFEKPLRGYNYPPRAYVRFESIQEGGKGNHQEQVGELIKQTPASIDNLSLKMLFVTVQQNNMKICIECAVNEYVFMNDSIRGLIYSAASWFGHCYNVNKDYGDKEDLGAAFRGGGGLGAGGLGARGGFFGAGGAARGGARGGFFGGLFKFVEYIEPFVKVHYYTPSLPAFAAILICLENSFWHAQQGCTAGDGFQMALNSYSTVEMDKLVISQWPNDWFTIQTSQSQAEHTRFTNVVLNNCLSPPKPVV